MAESGFAKTGVVAKGKFFGFELAKSIAEPMTEGLRRSSDSGDECKITREYAGPKEGSCPPMSKPRILIVEDKRVTAEHLRAALTGMGYEAEWIVPTAEEAVNLARDLKPDLILMDIMLAGEMDGVEAAQQIKSSIDIPIVFLSAYSNEETVRRATSTGPYGYLLKPFRTEEIRTTIETALYRHQMERRLRQSEKRLELAINGGSLGTWEINLKTGEALFDQRAVNMFGYSPQDLKPSVEAWQALVHPNDIEFFRAVLKEYLKGEKPLFELEHRIMHKCGEWRWCLARGQAVERDSEGKVVRMLGTNMDVTDRKRFEVSLTQRVSELKVLNELAKDVTRSVSPEEVLETSREHVTKLLAPDLVILYLREGDRLIPHDLPLQLGDASHETPLTKYVGECLCGLVASHGKPEYCLNISIDPRCTLDECKNAGVRSFAALPLSTDNEVLGVLGIASFAERDFSLEAVFLEALAAQISLGLRNATLLRQLEREVEERNAEIEERKRVEQALRKEVAFRKGVIESAAEGLCVFHEIDHFPFLRFTVWNDRMEEITGYGAATINELGWHQTVNPGLEARENAIDRLRRMCLGEDLRSEEWEITRADGEKRVLSISSTIIQSAGEQPRVLALMADVTERRKVEDELKRYRNHLEELVSTRTAELSRANEQLLRAKAEWELTFDSVPDLIAILSNENKILRGNKALAEKLGISTSELPGLLCWEALHGSHGAPPDCPHALLLADGGYHDAEITMDNLGGEFEVSVAPLRDNSGNTFGSVHVARDITQRKKTEAIMQIRMDLLEFTASHSLEELLQKTLDEIGALTDSPIGFYHFVEDDQETLSLQAWSTRTEQEFCTAEGKGLHYPISQAGVWVDCIRERQPVIHNDYDSLPHRKGMPEGHAAVIRELVVPTIRSGQIVAILGVGNKPSDYDAKDADTVSYLADVAWELVVRKRSEEALRESEARFRRLIEKAHLPLCFFNKERTLMYVNDRFTQVFGYAHNDIPTFREWLEHAFPDEHYRQWVRETWDASVKRAKEERRDIEPIEYNMTCKDGTKRLVEISGITIEDDFLATYRDITESRQVQKALQEAKEEAEIATRAKSQFLARMSHEIRTPINGIVGMTELALTTELTEEQRSYLKSVSLSADQLLRLIDDILDFSRIEAGKLEMVIKEFSLRDCVFDAMAAHSVEASSKGLELLCHVSPDVPEAVVGDEARLNQIVTNLVANAVKFTSQGEVVLEVWADSEIGGEVLLNFSVRDTGIGVPPEERERIFDLFEQAEGSSTRRYGGTGLGLAICKQLVHMMHGEIWIDTETVVGSTFHFTARFALKDRAAQSPHVREIPKLRGLKALVADDNATSRHLLEAMLARWGMKPSVAENGVAAVKALREAVSEGRPFDIALLDATMSDMDGFRVAESMSRETDLRNTPVIILGFARRQSDAERRERSGIATILPKPVNPSGLLNAIGAALAGIAPRLEDVPFRTRARFPVSDVPLRILLAEDQEINRRMAQIMLRRMGHEVKLAIDGRQALSHHEAGGFDLILMDVEMPEIDGIEATKTIREREQRTGVHVPIIAITAHALSGDRDRLLRAGMDGYLAKPIRPGELYATLERFRSPVNQVPEEENDSPVGESKDRSPGDLPGIDVQSALDRLHGDTDFFRTILVEFAQNYRSVPAQLLAAWEEHDIATLRRLVHAVKGVTGSLSATDLHQAATGLEAAVSEQDEQDVQLAFDSFNRTFQAAINAIDSLNETFPISADGPEKRPDKSTPPPSEDLSKILNTLLQLLRRHDTESRHVVHRLETLLSGSIGERPLAGLKICLERFDFQAAQVELARLSRRLNVALDEENE